MRPRMLVKDRCFGSNSFCVHPGVEFGVRLDDDRFAVMAGAAHSRFGWNGFRGYGDILVCDIARERCELAVEGPTDDGYRIVPHLDVPN